MRMAELSRESGVAVATIKYYLREELLRPGERTSPNQARYDDSHVRRLRLVRALLDVGKLSVAAVKDVVVAIDDPGVSVHDVLGVSQDGLPVAKVQADDDAWSRARDRVRALLAERGWDEPETSPLVESLTGVLATLDGLGHSEFASLLDRYADAAQRIAEADLDYVARLPSRESIVEAAVIGTVVGDTLFTLLRRIAHSRVSATVFAEEGAVSSPAGE